TGGRKKVSLGGKGRDGRRQKLTAGEVTAIVDHCLKIGTEGGHQKRAHLRIVEPCLRIGEIKQAHDVHELWIGLTVDKRRLVQMRRHGATCKKPHRQKTVFRLKAQSHLVHKDGTHAVTKERKGPIKKRQDLADNFVGHLWDTAPSRL